MKKIKVRISYLDIYYYWELPDMQIFSAKGYKHKSGAKKAAVQALENIYWIMRGCHDQNITGAEAIEMEHGKTNSRNKI